MKFCSTMHYKSMSALFLCAAKSKATARKVSKSISERAFVIVRRTIQLQVGRDKSRKVETCK